MRGSSYSTFQAYTGKVAPTPRRKPMTQERARYLMQTATARMSTGSECQECFSFGAHLSNCRKGE